MRNFPGEDPLQYPTFLATIRASIFSALRNYVPPGGSLNPNRIVLLPPAESSGRGFSTARTVLAQPEKMKALKHGLICKASRVEDLRLNSVKTWKHMVLNYIEITELSFLTESSEFELPSPLAHNQAMSISFTLDRFERGLSERSEFRSAG